MNNEKLVNRLRELSRAIADGPEAWHRELTMRVPADPERDADLVLLEAADALAKQDSAQPVAKHTCEYCGAHAGEGHGEGCMRGVVETWGTTASAPVKDGSDPKGGDV